MAVEGEEVEEYESDPEDAIVPSAMRRREASDDEEEDGGSRGGSRGGGERTRDRAVSIGSDGESDGEGAAPADEDEDEQDDDDEEYEEIIEEEIEGEEVEEEEEDVKTGEGAEMDLEDSRRNEEDVDGEKKEEDNEEEKKENEPYAVPTAGAFYMHDDRFQDIGRGRHRRMPGGRRLWESKDDRAWVHDRFEEMNLQEAPYDQGRRNSRGRFRGRGGGRTQGAVRGHAKGNNRSRGYYDDGNNHNRENNNYNHDVNNHNRDGDNRNHEANNHNRPQKSVRGRGPRRYEHLSRINEVSAPQQKQAAKSQESVSNTAGGRASSQTPNVQPDTSLPRKHVFASSLNSASPPFYPSGSSKQDISVAQKRDAQIGNITKTVSSSMQMENNFMSSQSVSMLRGKAVVDSVNHDRIYIDDSLRSVAGKSLANAQAQSAGSPLTSAHVVSSSQSRVQGRSLNIAMQPSYQPNASLSQVPRVPAQVQHPVVQQRPQSQFQPALRVSTQQVGQQRPASGNQVSSPPHASSTNISEVGEVDSPPSSSKSKTQLIAKGKTGNQGAGRGSFLYGGAQVIGASGAMGLSQNDQNFSATPALLPVMQFGGQHHGGLGVPAVGMALPGYVAQPQLGFGNSEMTWVPVLAGAAGALGASYPYIALDGSYYPRPSGQISSSVASKEAPKSANTLKPAQRPEIVNDEFGQRQNKPRRYSEMNFGQ